MMAIFLIITLFVLILGSFTDFKSREVPDWVNYSLIFAGVGIHGLLSVVNWSFWPLISSGVGLGIGVGVAFAMYYLGQWGGGDAKMLMGLGAIIGFDFGDMFFLSFILNAFILGAVYGIFYGVVLAVKNRKKFGETAKMLNGKTPAFVRRAVRGMIILALVFLIVFFVGKELIILYISALMLILGVFYYLFIFAKSLEKCCMLKYVTPSQLTEGDWIVNDVYVKGKKVCGPKDLGILKKQINALKRAKVKKILIKDGIPFVPSFLIAFVVTLFWGNVLFLLFTVW